MEKNYRIKITIDTDNNDYEYVNNITCVELLDKINKFKNLEIYEYTKRNIYECSFDKSIYGILIYFKDIINKKIIDKINVIEYVCKLKELFDIIVINIDNEYIYLTEKKYFENKTINDHSWYYCIKSFIQVHPTISYKIHKIIFDFMNNYSFSKNYIGLGGETSLFSRFKDFESVCYLSNSDSAVNDSIYNNHHIHNIHVDYNKIKLSEYIKKNTLLTVNIRKNGFTKNLSNEIENINISEILYIGCSDKTIIKDSKIILSNSFTIINKKRFKMFFETNLFMNIIFFKRID